MGKMFYHKFCDFFPAFKTILQHLCRLCHCSLGLNWQPPEVGLGLVLGPTEQCTCHTRAGATGVLAGLAWPLVLLP